MKRAAYSILLLFVFLVFSNAQETEKYIPGTTRKKEKCATAEPGTYLKPAALSILERMDRIMKDSTRAKEPAPWIMKIVTPHQKRVLDTLLHYNGLDIPVRIYYPNKQSLQGPHPLTLFFHGGGFVLGSIELYDPMAGKLARMTGQIVVSVDYRLAPEHPFPAAINDCFAVLRWVQQNGAVLGADTSRITVMGDSAGGNIATVLTLMCRDLQIQQPCCQVLFYPAVTFVDNKYPSMKYFLEEADRNYVLSESFLKRVREAYKGSGKSDYNPYLSPLEATLSDDLAPVLMITAECDPLRDSQRAYAEKLSLAGVKVKHVQYSGMIHGFVSFHMILSDAHDAMKQVRNYLDGN